MGENRKTAKCRGLWYQEQTLIPLLRWEVLHQSQSRPGKVWPCTIVGFWCAARLHEGVSQGPSGPRWSQSVFRREWKRGTCCAWSGCTCHFAWWKGEHACCLTMQQFMISWFSFIQANRELAWFGQRKQRGRPQRSCLAETQFQSNMFSSAKGGACHFPWLLGHLKCNAWWSVSPEDL